MKTLFFLAFSILFGSLSHTANAADDIFGDTDESGDLFASDAANSLEDTKDKNEPNGKVLSAFISSRIPASSAKTAAKRKRSPGSTAAKTARW